LIAGLGRARCELQRHLRLIRDPRHPAIVVDGNARNGEASRVAARLIEVKHISSSQFIHSADTQLPLYLKGEKAPFDIVLCIGYFDKDFDQGRLDLVNDACAAITTQGKPRIVPIVVDARPRASASKA
jgi:hypothetical protein